MISRPDPPLTYDEALDVLRQVYLGERVTVAVFAPAAGGFPRVQLAGRLDEVQPMEYGAIAWLALEASKGNESVGPPAGQRAGHVVLPRGLHVIADRSAPADNVGSRGRSAAVPTLSRVGGVDARRRRRPRGVPTLASR